MNALHQYQAVNTQTSVVDVDRHQLIQLLFDGAIERINMAKARINAKDFEGKNRLINKSIEIVSGLRGFLDLEKGQDLAQNLFDLYVYCEHKLFQANVRNDISILDEELEKRNVSGRERFDFTARKYLSEAEKKIDNYSTNKKRLTSSVKMLGAAKKVYANFQVDLTDEDRERYNEILNKVSNAVNVLTDGVKRKERLSNYVKKLKI